MTDHDKTDQGHEHTDEHPHPGLVGHEHQVAVHAGHDQATEEALAARASSEGTEHRTGHTDREGYPVHAGHAHVAGTDGPQGDGPGAEDTEDDTDDQGHNED